MSELGGLAETDEEMKRTVNSLSGGLAETIVYQNQQRVQFIHQSVNDYLIQSGLQNLDSSLADNVIGRTHLRLSRSCVKYLTLEEVLLYMSPYKTETIDYPGYKEIRARNEGMDRDFPLIHYTTENWTLHAKIVEAQGIPQGHLLDLFRWPSKDVMESWTKYCEFIDWYSVPAEGKTLLYIASQYGLLSVINAMITSGKTFDIDPKDEGGRTPLSWAAIEGQDAVVRLLIEQDVEIDSKDKLGRTPLWWAKKRGYDAVVQLLEPHSSVS